MLILTDDVNIYKICHKSSINCKFVKTNYSLDINTVGKVIANITLNNRNIAVCLKEYYKEERLNLENYILSNLDDNNDIINAYKPTNKSQFNFDMLIMSLGCKNDLNSVTRCWYNSYNDFQGTICDAKNLPDNIEFKNRRQFYMAKRIIDSYWNLSNSVSRNDYKMNIDQYYILALLLEQEELVKSNKQTMYYTLPVTYMNINGKLSYKSRTKFKNFIDAKNVFDKAQDIFTIHCSKFKTKTTSKKLLFNKPTLIKFTNSIPNNTEILNNLFNKGYITNPNTKNTNISSREVSKIIKFLNDFPQRYAPMINHIKNQGIEENEYKEHIYKHYVDQSSVNTDQTHAILPIPGNNINLLDENELAMYDTIVKRYFSIFLNPPEKYVQKIDAHNSNEIILSLQKDAYIKYGSDIFEMRKEIIYEELDVDISCKREEFIIGSKIALTLGQDVEIDGNVSREIKPLTRTQLLNKLTNMGKKMISRHLHTKLRHFQIGSSSSWNSYINKLENDDLIMVDDEKHYVLTDHGHKFINMSKAFLLNIENLNTLYLPIINVLTLNTGLVDVLKSHIETIDSIDNGPLYQEVVTANYNYIVNNYKCKCEKQLKEHVNFIGCNGYPECKFTISKTLKNGPNYKLKEKDIIELLTIGKTTTVVRNFKFIKSGKSANVTFKIQDNNWLGYNYHK